MKHHIDEWKSTPEKKKRHGLVILVLFVVGLLSWYLHRSTGIEPYRGIAIYATAFVALHIPLYIFKHILKIGSAAPLRWFESPITYLIPLLLIVFWFMFT